MAGEIQEKGRKAVLIEDRQDLKKYERELYDRLVHTVGLHKELLDAYGLDWRSFYYYFNESLPWSQKKEEFVKKIIEVIRSEYPGLHEVVEELESYLQLIRKFRER